MATPEFDILVIGGGSGGLVVAAGGSTLGAKVALVEKHKLGGDCLWYGWNGVAAHAGLAIDARLQARLAARLAA